MKPGPLPHQYWGLELRTSLTKAGDGAKFANTLRDITLQDKHDINFTGADTSKTIAEQSNRAEHAGCCRRTSTQRGRSASHS